MKPQLYSIVILLLARINHVQNEEQSTQNAATSSTELPPTPPSKTTVAIPPEDNVTPITKAPDDEKTETTENNVTPVTKAPKGSTTSVTKTSREIVVSEITTDKVPGPSETPNHEATPAPSLTPKEPPVHTTKGFTMTAKSDGTPRATGSTSVSTGKQTSNPIIVATNTTTQRVNKVTDAARKTAKPTSTKTTTAEAPGNGASAFPAPSLFAVVLLVISVLCF